MGNTQHSTSSVIDKGITEENLREAVKKAKGANAHVLSWATEDFTAKGDNYVGLLTCIHIKYQIDNIVSSVSFIAKLGVPQLNKTFTESINHAFLKECKVYEEIIPVLDSELISHGLHRLRVPGCYCAKGEPENQVMYLEDLRANGFQKYDNKKPLDTVHATLAVKELARLHAASLLLQRKDGYQNIDEKFPYLNKDCFDVTEDVQKMAAKMANNHIEETIVALKEFEGYQKAIDWLTDLKPQAYHMLIKQLDNKTKFAVFCHGDLWNGNLLFRYDEQGNPVEVMLVDLQQYRQASLAIDLKCLFYLSLTGHERTSKLSYYLDTYYASFKHVVDSCRLAMPFTREELVDEYRSKHFYGCFFAMAWLPSLLSENEDSPFENYTKDSSKETENTPGEDGGFCMTEKQKEKFLLKFKKYPAMTSRFLSLFDEIIEGEMSTLQ